MIHDHGFQNAELNEYITITSNRSPVPISNRGNEPLVAVPNLLNPYF